jgi:myo-inositol-1(or 4)-monophosphatase
MSSAATDIVTETDRAVEQMVSTSLRSTYPDFSFIGEETYTPGLKLTAAPTFIVDPIDGTTNFVHNFPASCISLGLAVNKIPVVGVIYNPVTKALYTGIQGQGSYLQVGGGEKLRLPLRDPEPIQGLQTCLVGAEWGSDREGSNFELKCQVFAKLAASRAHGGAMVHNIRSIGSAALNIALVAQGSQDIFWEGGCWAWDVCAGICILKEAGGIMVDGNPGDWEPELDCRRYLAVRGAPSGQKEVVKELWELVGKCGVGKMDYHA